MVCQHLSLSIAELEDLVRKMAISAGARAVYGAQPTREHRLPEYEIRFRPVSDVRKNLIVTYFTEPVDENEKPCKPYEDASAGSLAAARRAYVALDFVTIEIGINALRGLWAAAGVSLSASLFTSRH